MKSTYEERRSEISLTIITFPLIFIIVAVFLFFNVVYNADILNTTDTIDANVVRVEDNGYWDTDNGYHDAYHIYVYYEYGEKKYENVSIGTISSKYNVGESIRIRVSKDNPQDAYTTDMSDVFFPLLVSVAFFVFGIFWLIKFLKWQIEDVKETKAKGKGVTLIAFKLPSKTEAIVGLVLALIIAIFVILSVYVSNGFIIGAEVFFFFFVMWADCCLLL